MASVEQPDGSGPGEDRTLVPVTRRPSDYALTPAGGMLPMARTTVPTAGVHLLRRIGQHKWLIAVVALAVCVPTWLLVWLLMKPQYKAEGEIEIRPAITPLVDMGTRSGEIPFYDKFLNTQVAVMRGPAVLNRVLDSNEVRNTRWYRQRLGRGLLPTVESLREMLLIQPSGRTDLINVSAQMDHADEAVVLVKAVLDQYMAFVNESESQDSAERGRQLALEKTNLDYDIHERERQIDILRGELGTPNPDELVAEKHKRVDEMQARVDELARTIKLAEFDVNQERNRLGLPSLEDAPLSTQPAEDAAVVQAAASRPANLPGGDPASIYGEDLQWRTLETEVRTKQQELAIMRRTLGPSHPDIRAKEDLIRLAQANLQTRQAQLDRELAGVATGIGTGSSLSPRDTTVVGSRSSLARDLEVKQETLRRLRYEQDLLKQGLKKEATSSTDSFGRAEMLRTQLRELAGKQELQKRIHDTLERRRLEAHVPGVIRIANEPFLPDRPLPDRRLALSFATILLGLGVGVGVAFLRVKVNPNIQEVEELTESAPVPFLGQLPLVRARDGHALLDDPVLNEGIRMVRTPLLQRIDRAVIENRQAGSALGSVVLVTSAGPGDGKTTVTALLARSLANCGRRVLLVDADLRNPSVAGLMNLDNQRGLMDVLVGPEPQHDRYILRTDVERLSVLPTGNVNGQADPELIANGRFSAAIDHWREHFDVVLLDSPPVLPVADARILACAADGAILVVRAHQNQREEVIEAVRHLDAAGGKLWGTVLIRTGSRYYGYSSKYTYGYGARA
jgi:capsular exopolysaccharide synthesis family protein